MIECTCGKWYDTATRPDRCQCGQQLRLSPAEIEAGEGGEFEEDPPDPDEDSEENQ